jgi:hypothetical protein
LDSKRLKDVILEFQLVDKCTKPHTEKVYISILLLTL